MNGRPSFSLTDEAPATRSEPMVFVRTLSTPAGPPWQQARVAALEARIGAPLKGADILYKLRRIDGWRLGRPSRYAVAYVRRQEAGDNFKTTIDVAGRLMDLHFLTPNARNRRARSLGAAAAAVVVVFFSVSTAVSAALAARAETTARLDAAEQLATAQRRAVAREERSRRQARLLDMASARESALTNVLDELNWVASNKAPDAHIDAFHWRHGVVAVEVRGAAKPFNVTTRSPVKAAKPVRPGVWLWGLEDVRARHPRNSGGAG